MTASPQVKTSPEPGPVLEIDFDHALDADAALQTADLSQGLTSSYTDKLSAFLSMFFPKYQRFNALKAEIAVKVSILKEMPKAADRKAIRDEIKAIEEKALPPVRREIHHVLKIVAAMLAEDTLDAQIQRQRVETWKLFPASLRGVLRNVLKTKGLDVSDVIDKATALEDEERKRALTDDVPEEETPAPPTNGLGVLTGEPS